MDLMRKYFKLKGKTVIFGLSFFFSVFLSSVFLQVSCSKDDLPEKEVPDDTNNPGDTIVPGDTILPGDTVVEVDTAYIKGLLDTYYHLYKFENVFQYGPYNVHDPSIFYNGNYFYCYSTDVFYGLPIERAGIQVRRSKDLVKWDFIGWAYNSRPSQAVEYITSNGSTPVDNVWAPYIMKVDNQYRLYYSQAANASKLSAIGLTTSESPEGPWMEEDLVVTSKESIVMPNAIDPTVIVDQNGGHWMFYGSSWDGIYILELNSSTGLAKVNGSKGKRIAHRGFTAGKMNGNIEAPEIIYNPQFKKYYLFISYDWLETKYNVRVGRSDNVDGPYYDFNNTNLNVNSDNIPMILAPYAFSGHSGWQGTAHCAVFEKDGQFYIAHQGRPAVNKFFMNLHVRRILWTNDGWPVVSPERYAGITTSAVSDGEIPGQWERIQFGYTVVPGFSAEQTNPDIQKSVTVTLNTGGTINSDASSTWTFSGNEIELKWSSGLTDKIIVERGWDWEKKRETLLFTGLNNEGTTIWGKKIQ